MNSTHFVVTVKIERVDHIDVKQTTTGVSPMGAAHHTRRVVTSLANFTVRSDELLPLVDKVHQHLGLIDDIEAVDPEKGSQR